MHEGEGTKGAKETKTIEEKKTTYTQIYDGVQIVLQTEYKPIFFINIGKIVNAMKNPNRNYY